MGIARRRLTLRSIAYAWTLTAAAALHATRALRVIPSAVASLSGSAHTDTEHLVQEWAVAADTHDEQLQSIVSAVGCQVYVTYAPPATNDQLATVRVTADNEAIIQRSVEVVATTTATVPAESTDSSALRLPHQLCIQSPTKTFSNHAHHIEGNVRVEVIIHNQELVHSLQAGGAGDVVVEDGVLAAADPSGTLALRSSSSGNIYLPPQLRVHVNELQLMSSGAGNTRLVASDVSVQSVSAPMGGSGGIQFAALTLSATQNVTIASTGAGSADWYVSRFKTPSLIVVTSGSGDIKLRTEMASSGMDEGDDDVATCEFKSTGSGDIYAENLICTTAQATTKGSGDIFTAARQSLGCEVFGSGKVSATVLSSTADVSRKCKVRSKTNAATSQQPPPWVDTYTLPPRKTSFITLTFGDPESGTGHATAVTTTPSPSSDDSFPWKPLVFLAVVLVAVALYRKATVARDRRRQRPNEKTPLVRDDEPVYI